MHNLTDDNKTFHGTKDVLKRTIFNKETYLFIVHPKIQTERKTYFCSSSWSFVLMTQKGLSMMEFINPVKVPVIKSLIKIG